MTSFTDSTKIYDTTLEHCTCGDYIYRQAAKGGKCKHQKALIAEMNRAALFLDLKARFDCRENGDEETRRCYYEMALAS